MSGGYEMGPITQTRAEGFLRAIIYPLPSHFSLSPFLSTSKSSGKYHHGIHVSSDNRSSSYSRKSLSEYNIRRSWDDCLWFQQALENEYETAAREKKTRLMQGKGVKGFNGIYKQDLASSWDSLPPGPHPDSISPDIHQYLPSLTRRGTLFRASQATIDQRQAEFTSLIETLFSDGMPTLIKEIRASPIVSDFFGYWRRDCDYAKKHQEEMGVRRDSVTSSIFSSYFPTSHPPSPGVSPHKPPLKIPRKRSQPSATPHPLSSLSLSEITEEPSYPYQSPPKSRPRPYSTSSDSSAQSESSSDTSFGSSSSSTDPTIVEDVPIVFGHNPSDPSNSIWEALPEEQEIKLPESPQARPKPRISATERKANRFYSIIGSSLNDILRPAKSGDRSVRESWQTTDSQDSTAKSGDRSVRESWQTTASQDSTANDLLGELGLILPYPIKEQKFRASVASISTFMTTNSADAVIPRTPTTATASQSYSYRSYPRFSTPLTLSDFDVHSDEDNNSVLDASPRLNFSIAVKPESQPGNPVGDLSLPGSPSSTCTAFNYPTSETCSTLTSSAFSTTNSISIPTDSISIKAIHTTSIILLRVPRGIGLADLRQRLYNKFIVQEGIPLSETYKIAFVPPNPTPPTSTTNGTDNQLITLESDWEQLISTHQGSKVTLRILDILSI